MTKDLPSRPCVGVVLANTKGLIFTGERIDTPGAWQMPQGGIDEGEDPLAAAFRELEEETGLPGDPSVPLLEMVPDPMTLPALSGRVFAAWAMSWGKSNVMSTPASGRPKSLPFR